MLCLGFNDKLGRGPGNDTEDRRYRTPHLELCVRVYEGLYHPITRAEVNSLMRLPSKPFMAGQVGMSMSRATSPSGPQADYNPLAIRCVPASVRCGDLCLSMQK